MMKQLRSSLDGLASVSVIVAAGFLVWSLTTRPATTVTGAPLNRNVEDVEEAGLEFAIPSDTAASYAPGRLLLIEFADFECPFCGRHARDTAPLLMEEFVDPGQLDYLFVHFPLESIHQFARKASESAECARDQGKFSDMYHALFENQTALSPDDLRRHATEVGLNLELFDTCLGGMKAERIDADVAEGFRLGVNSTPTFMVGRVGAERTVRILRILRGTAPYSAFKGVLDELIDS